MKPLARIALAALGLALLPLSAANAYELPQAKWRTEHVNNRFNSQSHVQNGRFVVTSGLLSARSQKPGGGYYYNPVCKTPDGKIGTISPTTFQGYRWRWKCLGVDGGEVIENGSDFTWEYMGQVQNRGSISIYSLTFEVNGQERVICKGKVGGEELPGYFVMPTAGGVPGACQVLVMGQTVPATTFYVARRKPSGSGQPTLSNGAGWVPRPLYENGPQAEMLYRTTTKDGTKVLCRHKRNGKWWPGVLVPKEFQNKPGFACAAFIGTYNPYESYDYEVYVSSKRTSKFDWERYGHQTNFNNAVVLDPGTSASDRRYTCQVGANTVGYVVGSAKKCRIPQNPTTGASKFRTHMK